MLFYKVNILEELKKAGYNQTYLLKSGVIGQASVQSMRKNVVVGIKTIDKLCTMLNCQPGDIIGWKEDIEEKQT